MYGITSFGASVQLAIFGAIDRPRRETLLYIRGLTTTRLYALQSHLEVLPNAENSLSSRCRVCGDFWPTDCGRRSPRARPLARQSARRVAADWRGEDRG